MADPLIRSTLTVELLRSVTLWAALEPDKWQRSSMSWEGRERKSGLHLCVSARGWAWLLSG